MLTSLALSEEENIGSWVWCFPFGVASVGGRGGPGVVPGDLISRQSPGETRSKQMLFPPSGIVGIELHPPSSGVQLHIQSLTSLGGLLDSWCLAFLLGISHIDM